MLGVGVSHCTVLVVSAVLCRWVLCRAVVCSVVLWCVVRFFAVLLSHIALFPVVVRCCALSLGAKLCCYAVLLEVCCAVVPCTVFRGASCALLCCAVLACRRRFFMCSGTLPLLCWVVPCVAASCFAVFVAGFGSPLLSPGGVFLCWCPCVPAWRCALFFGVVCRGALRICDVSYGGVVPCGAVSSWCAVFFALLLVFVFSVVFCKPPHKP